MCLIIKHMLYLHILQVNLFSFPFSGENLWGFIEPTTAVFREYCWALSSLQQRSWWVMRFMMKENPSLMPLLVKNVNVFVLAAFFKRVHCNFKVKLSFKFTGDNVAIFKAFQIFIKQRRIQWFSLATTFMLSPLLSAPAIFSWLTQKVIKLFQTFSEIWLCFPSDNLQSHLHKSFKSHNFFQWKLVV